jgi:hypothetical protein
MPRGLYRVRDGWVTQHSVCVDVGGATPKEMPESEYREKGHQPPFEQLPWKMEDEGDAA